MGKKKAKKPQKSGGATSSQASDDKKKAEDPVEEEEIIRDDDLYISQNDVEVILNYIRTTNKSFQSLGNTLVETFIGRCAITLSQALFSLFEESTAGEKDDTIRRLNIIYMIYRLPEIETELRVKPTKTMNDIYNHIFAPFLYYIEESPFQYESILARVIVCNKASLIEKLTAPDFINKSNTWVDLPVDHEAYKNWENDNNAHWPKDLDDNVPVTSMMKHIGWERKDYESGVSESFYPFFHQVPTLLPPWLDIQREEVMLMDDKYLEQLSKNEAMWKTTMKDDPFSDSCDKHRIKLLDTLRKYEDDVDKFQEDYIQRTTPEKATMVTEEVVCTEPMDPSSSESGGSSQDIDDDEDSPFMTARIVGLNDNTTKIVQIYDEGVGKAVDAVIDGYPLNSTNTSLIISFIKSALSNTEYFLKIYSATKNDNKLKVMVRHNLKVLVPLLNRILINEELSTLERYLRVFTDSSIIVHAQEAVLKILQELKRRKKLNERVRKSVNVYVRALMLDEEVRRNRRNLRLVAIVLVKMLNEGIIVVEEIYNDMSEFTLKFTEVREVTNLYGLMTQLRNKRDKRAAEIAKIVAEEKAAREQQPASTKAVEPGPSGSS